MEDWLVVCWFVSWITGWLFAWCHGCLVGLYSIGNMSPQTKKSLVVSWMYPGVWKWIYYSTLWAATERPYLPAVSFTLAHQATHCFRNEVLFEGSDNNDNNGIVLIQRPTQTIVLGRFTMVIPIELKYYKMYAYTI